MMRLLLGLLLSLAMTWPVHASHALAFDAPGAPVIWMDVVTVERGTPEDGYEWIGKVHVEIPGESGKIDITGGITVEAYRFGKRLVLRYDGSDHRVPAFRLVVKGERASLFAGDKVARSGFSWLM